MFWWISFVGMRDGFDHSTAVFMTDAGVRCMIP